MNYKEYYPHLSKLETRLFEEKYWDVHMDREGQYLIVGDSFRWKRMMAVLLAKYPNCVITEEMINTYMDAPYKLPKPKRGPKFKDKTKNKNTTQKKWGKRTVKRINAAGEMKTYTYDY